MMGKKDYNKGFMDGKKNSIREEIIFLKSIIKDLNNRLRKLQPSIRGMSL